MYCIHILCLSLCICKFNIHDYIWTSVYANTYTHKLTGMQTRRLCHNSAAGVLQRRVDDLSKVNQRILLGLAPVALTLRQNMDEPQD